MKTMEKSPGGLLSQIRRRKVMAGLALVAVLTGCAGEKVNQPEGRGGGAVIEENPAITPALTTGKSVSEQVSTNIAFQTAIAEALKLDSSFGLKSTARFDETFDFDRDGKPDFWSSTWERPGTGPADNGTRLTIKVENRAVLEQTIRGLGHSNILSFRQPILPNAVEVAPNAYYAPTTGSLMHIGDTTVTSITLNDLALDTRPGKGGLITLPHTQEDQSRMITLANALTGSNFSLPQ